MIKTTLTTPIDMTCNHCGHHGLTHCNSRPSAIAWGSCILLCLVGCNLGCCCIPFCMDDCKDADHTCSACGREIAYKRAF